MTSNNSWQSKIRAQLKQLPKPLVPSVEKYIDAFIEAHRQAGLAELHNQQFIDSIGKVWAVSEFVAKTAIKHPDWVCELDNSAVDQNTDYAEFYQQHMPQVTSGAQDLSLIQQQLRQLRRQQMFAIAWWDIAGWATLGQTMQHLSALADACVRYCVEILSVEFERKYGPAVDDNDVVQELVVIAMGKLGSHELNFSSDIDLIFTYPRAGNTRHEKRSISNEEYFARMGKQLIAMLSNTTSDGFVFRVDMRLRPHGDSGPLVVSFGALEHYYLVHGRSWERYAMIKARAITGTENARKELMQFVLPFVYRRYLDYGAFDALRDMKHRIAGEVNRKGMDANIKLGWGGIREIEFIAQAFQLIRGGQETDLQLRQTVLALAKLLEKGHLPEYVIQQLGEAYEFLRNTEHRLQQFADQQTHQLPSDHTQRLRLAYALGYTDWLTFESVLNRHRERVQEIFEQVFSAPQVTQQDESDGSMRYVWQNLDHNAKVMAALQAAGYEPADEVGKLLVAVRSSARYRSLTSQAHQHYERLIPLVLGAAVHAKQPNVTLKRVLTILDAIGNRSSYLALLSENPMVLSQLVKLCDASAWLSQQLAHQPLLLDELLDSRTLYHPPQRLQLEHDLARRLSLLQADDLEQQMETIRHFKNASVLRVAAADISAAIPLMEVSNLLTDIAETVLGYVLDIAWRHLRERHGVPQGVDDDSSATGFAIIAFGKLGGIELGYGSDLDLVFLFGATRNGHTNGAKPIANEVFYNRLGQRIIHILTAFTPAGTLYEIDMRLRPSGESGLLVTHIDSFAEYQRAQAWTWEHQALVRARAVSGDKNLMAAFARVRLEVLSQNRDGEALREEVRVMRERMRDELLINGKNRVFDIKQGIGGITDIEFIVQYMVLAYAAKYSSLLEYTDNIRILDALATVKLFSAHEVDQVAQIYREFRAVIHNLNLQGKSALVATEQFINERETIKSLWCSLMLK